MWEVSAGIFMGWSLGSNDSANIFGTGVGANLIRYRTAIILISIFVVAGALLEGEKCFSTVGEISKLNLRMAFFSAFSAGVIVSLFTYFGLPVSTSQAMIGAVLGVGLHFGGADFSKLYRVVICWVLTPVGAMIISFSLYHLLGILVDRFLKNPILRDFLIKWGLILAGCFGAYALGSNNVANVTGVYVGSGALTPFEGALIGSLSIAFGVLTYSRKVMETVGKKIVALDGYSAFVAELSAAIVVEIFTQVGVPVSTSQAIVGAVAGAGLVKGIRAVSLRSLVEIAVGWVLTPLSSGLFCYILLVIFY
ncbi:MAG: inorganic phosphate transporter [Thermodesulfobacteriota bacterium]|nr:inorganic phosphate transporter [Thermodesulfobacteriota bacterium]